MAESLVKPNLEIHFHSCEQMPEVMDRSAKLVSVSSIDGDEDDCLNFYNSIVNEIDRVLADDGVVLMQISDFWRDGRVRLKSEVSMNVLKQKFRLTDVKIWDRMRKGINKIFPFSYFYVFVREESKIKRGIFEKRSDAYREGIWRFPALGKDSYVSWSPEICNFIINTFTNEEDLVIDMTTGIGGLAIEASILKRKAIGYEIDEMQKKKIEKHYDELIKKIC